MEDFLLARTLERHHSDIDEYTTHDASRWYSNGQLRLSYQRKDEGVYFVQFNNGNTSTVAVDQETLLLFLLKK